MHHSALTSWRQPPCGRQQAPLHSAGGIGVSTHRPVAGLHSLTAQRDVAGGQTTGLGCVHVHVLWLHVERVHRLSSSQSTFSSQQPGLGLHLHVPCVSGADGAFFQSNSQYSRMHGPPTFGQSRSRRQQSKSRRWSMKPVSGSHVSTVHGS